MPCGTTTRTAGSHLSETYERNEHVGEWHKHINPDTTKVNFALLDSTSRRSNESNHHRIMRIPLQQALILVRNASILQPHMLLTTVVLLSNCIHTATTSSIQTLTNAPAHASQSLNTRPARALLLIVLQPWISNFQNINSHVLEVGLKQLLHEYKALGIRSVSAAVVVYD